MPESLFNDCSGLQPAALLKEIEIRCFLENFSKFIRTDFFRTHTNTHPHTASER